MEVSVVLALVNTILQLLKSEIREEIEALWGYKSELDKLSETMETIKALFKDVEQQERQQRPLSNSLRNKLQRLKEAVYRADDLFDEVPALAHRKSLIPGNKVSKEVRLFFSRFNQLHTSFSMSHEIKKIKEILNGIAIDHRDFGPLAHTTVALNTNLVGVTGRETQSLLGDKDDIIGREYDQNLVIKKLLDKNNTAQDVSFVIIVGIGGLGKTTLAKLVYNDVRINKEFPLKMWICVSDDFDVKLLLCKILESVTKQPCSSKQQLELLQGKLRQALNRKKYLLVLDDVWNEDSEKWREFMVLLNNGGRTGSRILITTRSKEVINVVRVGHTLVLQRLSEEESLKLLERMTGKHLVDAHLVDIGKEIVGKCAYVPLAIRVVGSLLRGKGESSWESFRNEDLASINEGDNDIMRVLKISYYYLPSHLKNCFSYCAIFPKDYKIIKEDIICQWMAQGFIMPSLGQTLEDAGEEHFKYLLQRCFFQDVEEDSFGEISSFKMHDLIHDVAKQVAGTEILSSNYQNQGSFNGKTRHFFIDDDMGIKATRSYLKKMKRIRTILKPRFQSTLAVFPAKLRYLRVLDSRQTSFEKLPSTISALLHLRYLDLSDSLFLSKLPTSIAELNYLQTLKITGSDLKELPSVIGNLLQLRYLDLSENRHLSGLPASICHLRSLHILKLKGCSNIKELPRNMSKLVNLRQLDVHGCSNLSHMPPEMNRLTSLQKLTQFVVGGIDDAGGINDLKNLNSLAGSMQIKVRRGFRYDATEGREGGYLINKEQLRSVDIHYWNGEPDTLYPSLELIEDGSDESDCWLKNIEALVEGLQPHRNLRKLGLWGYPVERFPSWGDLSMNLQTSLPNLVEVKLVNCSGFKYLALMSQLHHLKVLELRCLEKLEYVERRNNIIGDDIQANVLVFFPSLEKLRLEELPNLKRWWNENNLRQFAISYSFPRLSYLLVRSCPKLTALPERPKLEELELRYFNGALSPLIRESNDAGVRPSFLNNRQQGGGRLRRVVIDNVENLNSLPVESFYHLSHLLIDDDHKIESLATGEVGRVFRSGRLSSLRSLEIRGCYNLRRVSGQGMWERLTALETLRLTSLYELELGEGDEITQITFLPPSLRSLELYKLPKLVKLPEGMRHLTSLHSLTIEDCKTLEALPRWIACLTSLQLLSIISCPKLKSLPEEINNLTSLQRLDLFHCSKELIERCQKRTGVDWPNIQHIPNIFI